MITTVVFNSRVNRSSLHLGGLKVLADASQDVAELGDGDKVDVVLVELRLTRKAELCDGDEVDVVLVNLHLTQKAELHDGDEAGIVLV